MISQDAMIRSAWHNQQFEEARKRVLDAMKYNLGHGYRLQHPGFRGLPDNSTGSKNRPFFAAKDEAHCPLEEKIHARGGGQPGALWNPAGRKYASNILQRRAVDTDALREGMEAPQEVAPSEQAPSDEKKLELKFMVQQLAQAIVAGRFSELTFDLYRRTLMMTLALIPFMDDQELEINYRAFREILRNVDGQINERVDDTSEAETVFLDATSASLDNFIRLIEEYLFITEGTAIPGKKRGVRTGRRITESEANQTAFMRRQIGLQPSEQLSTFAQTRSIDEKRTILKSLIKKHLDTNIFKGVQRIIGTLE